MTHDVWLARHPYLKPVAGLHAVVEAVAAEISIPDAAIPDWNSYAGDFHNGVPLLLSSIVPIDFSPAARAVISLTENLAVRSLPARLSEQIQVLDSEIRSHSEAPPVARGMVARWRFVRTQASGSAAVLRLDCAVPVSQTCSACVQKLARRRMLAAQLLPDLRIIPDHGSTGRCGSGTLTAPVMRLLQNAVALSANRVRVLRELRRSAAGSARRRRRKRSEDRLLRGLWRLSQNLQGRGKRRRASQRLDFTAPRHGCARSWSEAFWDFAIRVVTATGSELLLLGRRSESSGACRHSNCPLA